VQRLHNKVILLNHPETNAGSSQSDLAASTDASLLVSTSGELLKVTGKLDEGDKTDTDFFCFETPSKTNPDYEEHEETKNSQGPLQPLQESSGGVSAASNSSLAALAAARAASGWARRGRRAVLPTASASKQTSSAPESAVRFESLRLY